MYNDANRQAEQEVEQIVRTEAERREMLQRQQQLATQPTVPVSPYVRAASNDLRCPRCGEPVARDAHYCPNCRQVLSPSESGMHMRIPPSLPAGAHIAPPPPTVALAEQPTTQLPPAAVVEHPTIEIGRDTMVKRTGSGADDRTVPYIVQQGHGQRLGFVVGTRSDPGIKRKLKPNEDSLLAVQGVVPAPGAPGVQKFGLFVVADGMGGHANGQDASRLAIQTIIENVLPKFVSMMLPVLIDYGNSLLRVFRVPIRLCIRHNMRASRRYGDNRDGGAGRWHMWPMSRMSVIAVPICIANLRA